MDSGQHPVPIDPEQVRRIAHLARLELTEAEVALFGQQLAKILAYVEQLKEVDTEDVEPLAHPLPLTNVLRPDVPRPGLSQEAALQNAPDEEAGFFRVPEVLERGSGA